jgi:cysteine-rich repeat protein
VQGGSHTRTSVYSLPTLDTLSAGWTPRVLSRAGRAALGLVVALALATPGVAGATVPADLCTGNPCNVTASIVVDPGSVLDFGAATQLRLKGSAILTVGGVPGAFRSITLRAGSIVMEAPSRILGNGDGAAVTLEALAGAIDLQGTGSTVSRIVVTGESAGSIDLIATANVTVSGTLDVTGIGEDGVGGSISITAGESVALNRDVALPGVGTFASGGDLTVSAETGIAVNAIINGSSGGDGATMDLFTTTGDLTVTKKIDVTGGSPEGLGGSIDLTAAAGNVSLTGPIVGNGGTGIEESCGDGAEVNVTAGLAVSLGSDITVNAGTQCFGGAVTIVAGTTFTTQSGSNITATGPGAFGGGGSFTVQTGSDATLRSVNLTSPGVGGFVDIRSSSGTISFLGPVDARATGSFAIGGFSDVNGCNVTIASGAKIDVRGNFPIPSTGENNITAGGVLTIAGQLLASSFNTLEIRAGAPIITGTVTPAAVIIVNPALPDCAQMAACGDGDLDAGESCDDGNIANCDGCRADCQRADNVCGDGIRECGEQCDDGNTVDDDGCSADCMLPGTEGVRFAGSTLATAGCLAQWELKLTNPKINLSKGVPAIDQDCVDGDSTCDVDGQNNHECTFSARICLRAPDPRIPTCSAGPIEYVTLKSPGSLTQGAQHDRDNAAAIISALEALGGKVNLGGNLLQSGPALDAIDNCTAPLQLVIPRDTDKQEQEYFNILAHDTNNITMSSNPMRLHCLPNTAVCGNGVKEPTERCDDGNTISCDGCSATCVPESCGDGAIQCGEQCDNGPDNGTAGNRCSATCQELPPALRIPGGGSKKLDCGLEFSAELNPDALRVDAKGVPKTLQDCTDNDPACDLDPALGNCRVRLWTCAGAADARLGCVAAALESPTVLSPNSRATGSELAARLALTQALLNLPAPAGPGEVCSQRIDVDVPAGSRALTLRHRMRFVGERRVDTDSLRLRCRNP